MSSRRRSLMYSGQWQDVPLAVLAGAVDRAEVRRATPLAPDQADRMVVMLADGQIVDGADQVAGFLAWADAGRLDLERVVVRVLVAAGQPVEVMQPQLPVVEQWGDPLFRWAPPAAPAAEAVPAPARPLRRRATAATAAGIKVGDRVRYFGSRGTVQEFYREPFRPGAAEDTLFARVLFDGAGASETIIADRLEPDTATQGTGARPPGRARGPLFPIGNMVATPAALEALIAAEQTPLGFIKRHVRGDWGELSAEDKRANDQALAEGTRILSEYRTRLGTKLWIITEADRSLTTVLLPRDY